MPTGPLRISHESYQDVDEGKWHASVERRGPNGFGTAYSAGPFSTQFRAHVASQSLANRARTGNPDRYRTNPLVP
jgi:hypothetical protein